MHFLFSYDCYTFFCSEPNILSPSVWVLKDIIPADPYLLKDQAFWEQCLNSVICIACSGRFDITLTTEIIAHCETDTIRSGLLSWVFYLRQTFCWQKYMVEFFQLLHGRLQGELCFRGMFHREEQSPLQLALRTSLSASRFRSTLLLLNIDLEVYIRKEIEIGDSDWSEKSLLSLFMSPKKFVPLYMFTCRDCKKEERSYPKIPLPNIPLEVPWGQRLKRLINGTAVEASLTEEELQEREEWNELLKSFHYRCHDCNHEMPYCRMDWTRYSESDYLNLRLPTSWRLRRFNWLWEEDMYEMFSEWLAVCPEFTTEAEV